MNIGDRAYLICERHNYFSYCKDDACDACEIEALRARVAELQAEIEALRKDAMTANLDRLDVWHSVLIWNRSQKEPPITIGKEYFVAGEVIKIAIDAAKECK